MLMGMGQREVSYAVSVVLCLRLFVTNLLGCVQTSLRSCALWFRRYDRIFKEITRWNTIHSLVVLLSTQEEE